MIGAVDVEESEARFFVFFELSCHNKGSDSWIETFNRLLHEKEYLDNSIGAKIHRDEIPEVRLEKLRVRHESWTLEQLAAARRESTHPRREPRCDRCPILIFELKGAHFLLDGTTRTNRRILDKENGPHDVIVISCDEDV